jgi:hypothetical protein
MYIGVFEDSDLSGCFMFTNRGFREVFKLTYIIRGRFRTTKRSIEETLRLARLARELLETYLEVVVWEGEKRVLKLRK